MRPRRYFVYMLTNRSRRTLCIGFSNNLRLRLENHHTGYSQFTSAYRATRLVYFEIYADVRDARQRERSLKRWLRAWKDALVESVNPTWRDVSGEIPFD